MSTFTRCLPQMPRRSPVMLCALLLPLLLPSAEAAAAAAAAAAVPDALRLSAEPHFRDVTLRWEWPVAASALVDFQVRYCELQAWGLHRCRSKVVPGAAGREALAAGGTEGARARLRVFATAVGGLRMATNYSFDVQPLEGSPGGASPQSLLPMARRIVVPTKGFSARATQCLPHASEVEVTTGPYFGGRIAVEAAGGERCALAGDPRSSRDAYVLRIDHEACGARLNATTVAAFVLVQENLPILTHSTRRFLVLCSYHPDTLTVRAGINLPTQEANNDPESNNRLDLTHSEAIPQELIHLDTVNDVQVSKLQHHRQIVDTRAEEFVQDQSTTQFVLIFLIVAGIIGCVVTMWCFVPTVKKLSTGSRFSAPSEEPTLIYENLENSLRDTASNLTAESEICIEDMTTPDMAVNSHMDQDSTGGVFTIQTPTPKANQKQTQFRITIESTSHSEV